MAKEQEPEKLGEVEYMVRSTVADISNTADLQGAWNIFNAKCLTAKRFLDTDSDEYTDTLITLTKDSDKRVVLFSIVYLGASSDDLDMAQKMRSIDAINAANIAHKDHVLNIAQGLSTGRLGYMEGLRWISSEMERANIEEVHEFLKSVEIDLIHEVMNGWK
jgi:hypothetical protein